MGMHEPRRPREQLPCLGAWPSSGLPPGPSLASTALPGWDAGPHVALSWGEGEKN